MTTEQHNTANSDQAEIRKFEALASRWWDPNSEFKPLHEINPLRMGFISSKVNLTGKAVVDIGCGGGILSEAMARHGAHVTAIDLAEASLAVARLHQLESGLAIRYENISTEDLARREPGRFDVTFTTQTDGKALKAGRSLTAGEPPPKPPDPAPKPTGPAPTGSVKWM